METQEPIPCVALADADALQLATADTTAAPWEPLGLGIDGIVPLEPELEDPVSAGLWIPGGGGNDVCEDASSAPPPPSDAAAMPTAARPLAVSMPETLPSIVMILLNGWPD